MPALGGKRESTGFFNTARPYGERESRKVEKSKSALPSLLCAVCAVLCVLCCVHVCCAGLGCAVLCCAVLCCAVCCVLLYVMCAVCCVLCAVRVYECTRYDMSILIYCVCMLLCGAVADESESNFLWTRGPHRSPFQKYNGRSRR